MPKFKPNLSELYNIAVAVTKDSKVSVIYDNRLKTAFFSLDSNTIALTSNGFPKQATKYPRIHKKLLDGLVSHEGGHSVLTSPIWTRYKAFIDRQQYPKLAKYLENIIEDKRVNYFIEARYRFDLGKRLELLLELEKDSVEASHDRIKKQYASAPDIQLLLGAIVQKGLYNADISPIELYFTPALKNDLRKCLNILERAKYLRVKYDLVKALKELYDTLAKYVACDIQNMQFVPVLIEGGSLKPLLSKQLQKELEKQEKERKERKKSKCDDAMSAHAGKGTGEEIPSPKADLGAYLRLVERNQPEIRRLLDKLKVTVKPQVRRARFQKRGRFMAGLLAKAYTRSLKGTEIRRIFYNVKTKYEKEKISLQILVDFSGSMSRTVADNTITILNEVFGNWLEDKAYSIAVFGADYQKIKTFFESFDGTRARIGGISVNAGGTMCAEPLKAIHKMFNATDTERRRILVLASDFSFGDHSETETQLRLLNKHGVTLLLVGLCWCHGLKSFLKGLKNVYRAEIKDLHQLPELFLNCYLKSVGFRPQTQKGG